MQLIKKRQDYYIEIRRAKKKEIFKRIRKQILTQTSECGSIQILHRILAKQQNSLANLISYLQKNQQQHYAFSIQLLSLGIINMILEYYPCEQVLSILNIIINLNENKINYELASENICSYLINKIGIFGWEYNKNYNIIINFNKICSQFYLNINDFTQWQTVFDKMLFSALNSDIMEFYGHLIALNVYKNKYNQQAQQYFTQLFTEVQYKPCTSQVQVVLNTNLKFQHKSRMMQIIQMEQQQNQIKLLNNFCYKYTWIYYKNICDIIMPLAKKYINDTKYQLTIRNNCIKILTNILANEYREHELCQIIMNQIGQQNLFKLGFDFKLTQFQYLLKALCFNSQVAKKMMNTIKYLCKKKTVLVKQTYEYFAHLVYLEDENFFGQGGIVQVLNELKKLNYISQQIII